ncbi:MAG: hypothetical protein ACAF41_08955 [Leptolyngbya sp. BL-A-14]
MSSLVCLTSLLMPEKHEPFWKSILFKKEKAGEAHTIAGVIPVSQQAV